MWRPAQVWKFKGSIFLTFKTEEAAKAFVEKEEKYKDGALLKKFQKDYLEEKKKEMDEKRNKFGKSNTKKPKAEGADGKEEVIIFENSRIFIMNYNPTLLPARLR